MSAIPSLFLGLDVGTQSVRAALFDATGVGRGFGVAPLDTFHPQPAWAEQDANQWWTAACAAVPEALARAGASADDVAGIGLDCTSCTVIACALDGTPLRRALLWMDQRAYHEANDVSATKDPMLRWVSGVLSPEWMLPKALWLKRHEADVYNRAGRIVECTDWFMHRLTGAWTLSLNNITVKWNYARPDGGWNEGLLSQIGLDELPDKWPQRVVPLGKGEAKLSAQAAAELGLRPETPVAQGGIDAYLGMLGVGAVRPGDLAMIIGSSTCHLANSTAPLLGSGMSGCYPDAVIEGTYTLEGGQTATGSILDWYRRHFAGHETAEAAQSGRHVYEVLDAKAAAVAPGSDGLICLDYWQGNRCPLKDPRGRGALWGLTLAHGPGHVFRSIYEGTAYGTRHILEDLKSHGFKLSRLFAGGGGAKSRLWIQIQADVLNQPVALPDAAEPCALGSALLAAVNAKHYADLTEAAKEMVRIAEVVEPRSETRAVYDEGYARYRATYPALRELMHRV